MNSRERLLGAMYGRPIDRVPISTYELVGWAKDAWENKEPSYSGLMKVIRERTDCIYMTGPGAIPPKESSLESGTVESSNWREGSSSFTKTIWHTPKGDLSSLHRKDDDIYTTWTLEHLLDDTEDIDKYLSMPWHPPEPDMDQIRRQQEELGDKGVLMISVSDPVCEVAELFEMGEFLVQAMTQPKSLKRLCDAIHERQMDWLRKVVKYDVKDIQFRICGPEYATPPYLSPERFNDFVVVYLREIIETIRTAGGWARVHCHGKVAKVLDMIVDAGAQGLDPCEPPPDGDITLGEIKKRYGNNLCLLGNIELKELEFAPESRLDELVKQAMDEAKDGGRFILMPTAAPINVPLSPKTEANYKAYIDAGHKYGHY